MKTHYIGFAPSGTLLSRASTRKDFTHAGVSTHGQLHFSTSYDGALRLAARPPISAAYVAPVRIVTRAEYDAARKAAGKDQLTAG